MAGPVEIRDPIHGFIELDEWERDIVNHPVFQRLRRIRQLGLTDMVYPGATHSRFEHSLGVMHVATKMFDAIVSRRYEFLKDRWGYNKDDFRLARRVVKLAALLHDVGHAPLSHTGEDLMPKDEDGEPYTHEDYSGSFITNLMRDVIDAHPTNQSYGIKSQHVADFLAGKASVGRQFFWTNLISGQLDADRADYLLRDSHHIGVAYGHYDLQRLLTTVTVTEDPETGSPELAIDEGGWHTAEGLIIARYMMFTQVYFHRVRRAYDRHAIGAMRSLLQETGGYFPPPTDKKGSLSTYFEWDDWRVFGSLAAGEGGHDGEVIRNRNHDRCVFETPESPEFRDGQHLESIRKELGDRVSFVDRAERSWYKFDNTDILIVLRDTIGGKNVEKLSQKSSVVSGLKAVNQHRIYVPVAQLDASQEIVERFMLR